MKRKILALLLLVSSFLQANAANPLYGQCGGIGWTGVSECVSGATCTYVNDYYSQCLPGTGAPVDCPKSPCDPGGCGSSQCTITQNYPTGLGGSKSVTAQPGYFACCWKEPFGDLNAKAFSTSCCPKK
jgi:hypothetical protein